MVFWEKCFQRTYQAFSTDNYGGRAEIEWWIEAAVDRKLLRLNTLSSSALCAILRTVGTSSSIGRNAHELLMQKSFKGADPLAFERPDYRVALSSLVMDRDDLERRGLSFYTVCRQYVPDLFEFLCRFFLTTEDWALRIATASVKDCYNTWNPLGIYSFESDLLCRIRDRVDIENVEDPQGMPNPFPAWLAQASLEEQTFLYRMLTLDTFERKLLLQSLYAGMTPREIAPALLTGGRPWPPIVVELKLREAWKFLFRVL